jgi:hypothetical protein
VSGTSEEFELRAAVCVDRRGAVVGRAADFAPFARDPRLSPDGRRFALTAGPAGYGDIWIYDPTGRPPLRPPAASDNRHAWQHHDGDAFAFTSPEPLFVGR